MRPAALWGLAALLMLSLAWGAASAVYLAGRHRFDPSGVAAKRFSACRPGP